MTRSLLAVKHTSIAYPSNPYTPNRPAVPIAQPYVPRGTPSLLALGRAALYAPPNGGTPSLQGALMRRRRAQPEATDEVIDLRDRLAPYDSAAFAPPAQHTKGTTDEAPAEPELWKPLEFEFD